MSKILRIIPLVLLAMVLPVGFAQALIAIMPVGPTQIATADAVFVGKVTAIEPVDVGEKGALKYRIAIVTISEAIRGVKDVKSVRVGFIPPTPPKVGAPKIGGGPRNPQLTVGQEGLFILSMHPEGKFYQAPNFGAFTASAQPNYKADVDRAKRVAAVMANTKQALQSKDADERLMAASILVAKYRTQRGPGAQQEPIDADESKLILNAIANASWKPARFGDPNPYQLFNQLGITAQDGWKAPVNIKTQDDLRDAVQAWVKDNGDTYRIKRFVAANEK